VLLLGTAVFSQAADDLTSAFKDGKLDGRIRVNSINTDWDKNEWGTGANQDSHGTAIGGSLIYQTAPLYSVSAGIGFYTTNPLGIDTDTNNGTTNGHPKNTTASDLFSRGPGSATNFGTGYSLLAQSYLQYEIAKSKIKGGRFLMTNPWINPNDTKMIPIAVEGGSFVSNDLANTTIQIDFANKIKERGMTYFGNMADTGDTPDAIKNYYLTHYTTGTAVKGDAPCVAIIGMTNRSINSLEIQAWFMNWQTLVNQGRLEANFAIPAGDVILSFGARYMQQWDTGAGAIIKPGTTGSATATNNKGDSDNSVATNLYAVRTAASYRAAKLMLAYSHTSSDGDFIAPWRGFPTDGYTRSMTQTDWNANTSSYKAQVDYDINQYIKGLSAMVSYSFYDRDPSKIGYVSQTDRYYNNGDTRQWNLDLLYKVPAVKNLELKARYMIQNNDKVTVINGTASQGLAGNDTSNHEYRLEANYRF
jgi:hypothetical protein